MLIVSAARLAKQFAVDAIEVLTDHTQFRLVLQLSDFPPDLHFTDDPLGIHLNMDFHHYQPVPWCYFIHMRTTAWEPYISAVLTSTLVLYTVPPAFKAHAIAATPNSRAAVTQFHAYVQSLSHNPFNVGILSRQPVSCFSYTSSSTSSSSPYAFRIST